MSAYLPLRGRVRSLSKAGDVAAAAAINNQTVARFNTVQGR
jgi:hypothetical protein